MHVLGKKLLSAAYIISIVKNFPSAINPPAAIDISYGSGLSYLAKIYINNVKYSGHNDGFFFKLVTFHAIFFRADVLPKPKIKAFFTLLKDLFLDNCFSNIGISNTIINSD